MWLDSMFSLPKAETVMSPMDLACHLHSPITHLKIVACAFPLRIEPRKRLSVIANLSPHTSSLVSQVVIDSYCKQRKFGSLEPHHRSKDRAWRGKPQGALLSPVLIQDHPSIPFSR